MPDVKFWLKPYDDLDPTVPSLEELPGYDFYSQLAKVVAEQMSCKVDGEFYSLDPNDEVDITVVANIAGQSGATALVEIAAYNFPDRMQNIDERIGNIGLAIKKILSLKDEHRISVTFIPVRQGCWVKV